MDVVGIDHVTPNVPPAELDLLTEATVIAYLRGRGLLIDDNVAAQRLTGGVSNIVLRVPRATGDVVVKQALGRLAVADEWLADRSRSHTEAMALSYLTTLLPGFTPALIDDDPRSFALTIEAAPQRWPTLKSVLLAGDVPVGVLYQLGAVLKQWHAASAAQLLNGTAPSDFDTPVAFRQLRLDPYFERSAQRRPAEADALRRVASEIAATRTALVLGDFSPKNILVERDKFWVIDLEVAHYGDPAFDVAFMCTHLLLKWLHLPGSRSDLDAGIHEFLRGYERGLAQTDPRHVAQVLGCLLIARVVGSSPAEYLTASERDIALRAGIEILTTSPSPADWIEALR